MSEFEAITSQEQLDGILKDRLARKDAQHEKVIAEYAAKLSEYDALKAKNGEFEAKILEMQKSLDEANLKITTHDTEIAERDAKLKAYELDSLKTHITLELGVYDAIDYVSGTDEESIRKSAEGLKSLVGKRNVAPLASGEIDANSERAAMKNMLQNLNLGGH